MTLPTWVSAHPDEATRLSKSLNGDCGLKEKALEVDAWGECHYGAKILETNNGSTYPWIHQEYCRLEAEFIYHQMTHRPPERIMHIGHGAIPRLILALYDFWPQTEFTLVDRDPRVEPIAVGILSLFAPKIIYHQKIGDFFNLSDYDESLLAHLFDSIVLSNAVVPALHASKKTLPAHHLFVRSASESGALVYPRLIGNDKSISGFQLKKEQIDPLYGIHDWLFFSGISEVNQE